MNAKHASLLKSRACAAFAANAKHVSLLKTCTCARFAAGANATHGPLLHPQIGGIASIFVGPE